MRLASEELLELREVIAEVTRPLEWAYRAHYCSIPAWTWLYRQCPDGVRRWITDESRTHLEVVEMIERAVVEAKRAEGEM